MSNLTAPFRVNTQAFSAIAEALAPAIELDRTEIAAAVTEARRALGMSREAVVSSMETDLTESRLSTIESGATPTVEEAWALVQFILASFDEEGNIIADQEPAKKPPAKKAAKKTRRRKPKAEPEDDSEEAEVISITPDIDPDEDDDDEVEFEEEDEEFED